MNNPDNKAFIALYKEAYQKCFGQSLERPLTETESKLLCNRVLELTGLSVGWKSVKNYSFFINGSSRSENPSAATLDTLARYVLSAPYTTELERKKNESHYPYWFLYREKFVKSAPELKRVKWRHNLLISLGIANVSVTFIFWLGLWYKMDSNYTDNFRHLSDYALSKNGWIIKDKDTVRWKRRSEIPGQLSLFTLTGDNWPSPGKKQSIKNLLLRPVTGKCFTAEVHLKNFIPREEWQQAGILLLEDTALTGKSIRMSIAFNDNFGGYTKPKEVLVQIISSLGNGFGKPEEIAHQPVLLLDSAAKNPTLLNYMQNAALRIEKQGKKFRFLYAEGSAENGAFREVASQEFDMQPAYIGLFAIKGFRDSSSVIPAHFTFFKIASEDCK